MKLTQSNQSVTKNRKIQANLSVYIAILSGLVLEDTNIQVILKSDMMEKSSIY